MTNTAGPELSIRLATSQDLPRVLAVMDGIMDWLVGLGRVAQWGTDPWSTNPLQVERLQGRIDRKELRVAVTATDEIAGILSVSETPGAYIEPVDEPELFINLLATSRAFKGHDVGGFLIAQAVGEATRRDLDRVRVDCFAGDDGRLKAWYAGQGFVEIGPFEVPRETGPNWPGMLFAMRLK